MAQIHSSFIRGAWRNGRRYGLKIRWPETVVWVQVPPPPSISIICDINSGCTGMIVDCWYRFRLDERHDIEDMAVPGPRYHSGATENNMIQRFQIYCHQSLCFSLNFQANGFLVFLKPPLYLPTSPRTFYVWYSTGWANRLVWEILRRWEPIFYLHPAPRYVTQQLAK